VEAIFYCPHIPEDDCDCRKPKPGLFLDIEKRLGKSLEGSYAVGDSARDLEAAKAVKMVPILVKTGKGERTIASSKKLNDVLKFSDLSTFVDALIAGKLNS
jgi:D-glycero-D-manno-heptose 1,7-bisphosphate phosphatase